MSSCYYNIISSAMSENIYNLVPREYVPPVKEPMHKSNFDPKANLTGSTFGNRQF